MVEPAAEAQGAAFLQRHFQRVVTRRSFRQGMFFFRIAQARGKAEAREAQLQHATGRNSDRGVARNESLFGRCKKDCCLMRIFRGRDPEVERDGLLAGEAAEVRRHCLIKPRPCIPLRHRQPESQKSNGGISQFPAVVAGDIRPRFVHLQLMQSKDSALQVLLPEAQGFIRQTFGRRVVQRLQWTVVERAGVFDMSLDIIAGGKGEGVLCAQQ